MTQPPNGSWVKNCNSLLLTRATTKETSCLVSSQRQRLCNIHAAHHQDNVKSQVIHVWFFGISGSTLFDFARHMCKWESSRGSRLSPKSWRMMQQVYPYTRANVKDCKTYRAMHSFCIMSRSLKIAHLSGSMGNDHDPTSCGRILFTQQLVCENPTNGQFQRPQNPLKVAEQFSLPLFCRGRRIQPLNFSPHCHNIGMSILKNSEPQPSQH